MAFILKNSIGILDQANFAAMQPLINQYWGQANLEKTFPIPLWKMKQLFNAFPSSEVALKVTDIFSTTLVDAEWIAFDEDLEGILSNVSIQPNTYYFVLSEANFEALRQSVAGDIGAGEFFMITGRLAKSIDQTTQEGHYHAYICASKLLIIKPGGGNEGASTGFKLPPT